MRLANLAGALPAHAHAERSFIGSIQGSLVLSVNTGHSPPAQAKRSKKRVKNDENENRDPDKVAQDELEAASASMLYLCGRHR